MAITHPYKGEVGNKSKDFKTRIDALAWITAQSKAGSTAIERCTELCSHKQYVVVGLFFNDAGETFRTSVGTIVEFANATNVID